MSYAFAGLVNWSIAGLFVVGGLGGGLLGSKAARRLGQRRGVLNMLFAGLIIVVAIYMLVRTAGAF